MKVLVVDDDEVNRNLVTTLLRHVGHEAVEAVNGSEALDLARSEHPDLIITDLLMPVMDGYELIREVRSDADIAATPAIFYTANYLNAEAAPIASSLGVQDILVKPIDPRGLLAAVEGVRSRALGDAPVVSPTFNERHRRALNSKLVDKVHDLEVAESALRASEALFRVLAEHAPIGIFSITSHGEIAYANPGFAQIVTDAATGERLVDFVHPADREWFATRLDKAIMLWESVDEQVRLANPAEHDRWVRVRLGPLDATHDGVTLVGTVEDITAEIETKQARDELARRLQIADRLESLGQLAAGIAHDFNNVLSLITSYNEFVISGLASVSSETPADQTMQAIGRAVDDATSVQGAAERAVALTRRLLLFAGRSTEAPERVNLNAVLDGSIGLLAGPASVRSRIHWTLAPRPVFVMADRTQIEQIVMNLVVNARDAQRGQQDARINIECRQVKLSEARVKGLSAGTYAQITVRDNGAGIAPDVVEHIFEPFFTTKPAGEGTGLGLSTVHRIVTALGGAVTVQSTVDVGTAFNVYLPIAEQ